MRAAAVPSRPPRRPGHRSSAAAARPGGRQARGPLAIPVTAQLVDHETGVCWEATYSAPSKNDGLNFKAKSD
jgi:hypothetical protein